MTSRNAARHETRNWSPARISVGVLSVALLATVAVIAIKAARSFYFNAADYGGSGGHPDLLQHPERTAIDGISSVSIQGPHGQLISGWYVPSRNRAAVILIGGTGANRSQMLPEAGILAAAGFGVLLFDWPGTGLSQGPIDWGEGAKLALTAALDWTVQRSDVDPHRVGALGFSVGSFEIVRVAARDPRVACAVLTGLPAGIGEAPQWFHARAQLVHTLPAEWARRLYGWPVGRERAIDLIGALAQRPVLIVGGTKDPDDGPVPSRQLYEAAGEPKSLWIIDGAGHGGYAEAAGSEYSRRITEFFAAGLLRN